MIVETLRDRGIVCIDSMPGAGFMLEYLSQRPQYHGHVKGTSVAMHQPGNSTCWSMEDVLQAPNFLEFALSLTDVVEEYLKNEPLLYSVNAFTTYPITGPMNPDIQEWHRDRDDVRFVALFVYLTDVWSEADGMHLFKSYTHDGDEDGPVVGIRGGVGTAFLADTRGLHMGVRPSTHARTMAWARWCVTDPPASYVWDGQKPTSSKVLGSRYPTDEHLRSSIRLVVR